MRPLSLDQGPPETASVRKSGRSVEGRRERWPAHVALVLVPHRRPGSHDPVSPDRRAPRAEASRGKAGKLV